MDLVDIDKVLDDLELDEDERLPNAKPNLNRDTGCYHTLDGDGVNFNEEKLGTSADCDLNKGLTDLKISSETRNISDDRSSKNLNRFVAVSQVFSSLDDYCRDVQSLRVGLNKLQADSIIQKEDDDVPKDKNIKTDDNKITITNDLLNGSKTSNENKEILQSSKNDDTINRQSSTYYESTSNSKLLPSETIKTTTITDKSPNDEYLTDILEDDDSDGLTSASSITTSSPSSFSSGPSPRSSLSVDCIIGNSDSNEYELNQQNNSIQKSDNIKTTTDLLNKNKLNPEKSNNKSKSIKTKINYDEILLDDSNGQNSIDLVGLSSVSSCLYVDNSLSSNQIESLQENQQQVQQPQDIYNKSKILDKEKTTESVDIITRTNNETIDTDNLYTTTSNSEVTDRDTAENLLDCKNFKVIDSIQQSNNMNVKNYDKNVKDKKYQVIDGGGYNDIDDEYNKKVPVTFGSTMDEISDTELDSMLQDIDNELQNNSEVKNIEQNVIQVSAISSELSDEADQNLQTSDGGNKNLTSSIKSINKPIEVTSDSLLSSSEIQNSQLSKNDEQQIDIEEAIQIGKFSSTIDSHHIEQINVIENSPKFLHNKKLSITSTHSDNFDENFGIAKISYEDDNNLQNADSFSQASTIEFADLQLRNETDCIGNIKCDNSSLEQIGIGDDIDSDKSDVDDDLEDERSTSSNSGTKNYHTDFQSDDNNRSHNNIFQRPNSLDLPAEQRLTTTITKIGDMNVNKLNLNAGQTPPASNKTLNTIISSCSSDDSTVQHHNVNDIIETSESTINMIQTNDSSQHNNSQLGKVQPFWIPDSDAASCMQCKLKFSIIKRRHHCRACGQVLCSMCCSQKAKLEFLGNDNEARVCVQCHLILNMQNNSINTINNTISDSLGAVGGGTINNINSPISNSLTGIKRNTTNSMVTRSPNPNNPMEYCSTIPPHEQVKHSSSQLNQKQPISVMVPVGVLKREGVSSKNRKDKNVIFSDGIRPGCDLADLDNSWGDSTMGTSGICNNSSGQNSSRKLAYNSGRVQTPPGNLRINRKPLPICDENDSFIPKETNGLPPIYVKQSKADYDYKEVQNNTQLIERLQNETLQFAVQRNFYVFVKIVKLKCCINKTIINFTTHGMHHVGQDEIIILLEYDNSNIIPKDIFIHLNEIYRDADKGQPITELGFSMPKKQNFLDSKEHGGFLYIRSTFQCLQEIHLPESPFLIGVLIHRWEVPWAKIFPLRLMLRLGAQYRYYPSPHISIRGRDSVYAEIAQTIINFLADFRNYSYTIATIKGMYIHMEDRKTSVLLPKNRYDQIVKALNNSSDHILALGGNFSKKADGHLVCIQNLESDCADTHTYSTQAINIQGQPRKVTGASFIVLNGALKTTSGLSGKCSIVEDGLMVQILSQKMQSIRNSLKNMKDIEIICGPVDADESQTEVVCMQWIDNDVEFNIGVKSPIDLKKMDGIPSIRVHSGLNYSNANHIIRWTEVFIIQSDEESVHGKDPIDMSTLSEQIARSTSTALASFLDLLAANGCVKIALRATLSQDNVCYEAGSQNSKLAPLYMNALDHELIPILHKHATMLEINSPIILELIFHILDK